MRLPRLPILLAVGVVLLTSMPTARARAAEPASSTPSPYVIAIDPGHGGSPTSDPSQLWDPGVVNGSIMEKDITLDLAMRLRKLLERERVKVVLTRSGDRYVEISQRWNIAHLAAARLFISLHVNAFDGDPSINGATIFYPRADSLPFAQALDTSLGQALERFQIADDGIAPKPELWVRSDVPTATIEPVYLTNPREAGLLKQGDFRDAIALGLYQGMLNFDPAIEQTRLELVRAEGAAAAQHQAQAAASDSDRSSTATRWAIALGGLLLLFFLTRAGIRRQVREPQYRRRSYRRRRAMNRRF